LDEGGTTLIKYVVDVVAPALPGMTKPTGCALVGPVVVNVPAVSDKNTRSPGVTAVCPASTPLTTISTVAPVAPPLPTIPTAGRNAESFASALYAFPSDPEMQTTFPVASVSPAVAGKRVYTCFQDPAAMTGMAHSIMNKNASAARVNLMRKDFLISFPPEIVES
jgi:hypothetical protein